MPQPLSITLAALAARTTAGSGDVVDMEDALHRVAKLAVRVTELTASDDAPLLTLSVMTSDDEATWRNVEDIALAEVSSRDEFVEGLSRYVRLDWTLADITSVTFSVDGISHVVYCDPGDIVEYAIPERAIAQVTQDRRIAACISASDQADGYLSTRKQLPLLSWGNDLREHVANIAAAALVRHRGVDPQSADAIVFDGRDQAMRWLKSIATGAIDPPGMVDSTTETNEGGSVVVSSPSRGW